jgi:hypothetical protein
MLNLLIAILIICSSIGATLSKITTDYGFRKHREHVKPLTIDKDLVKA